MNHPLSNLKPKQLHFIENLYQGIVQEGIDLSTSMSFSRSWIKYMSSKYVDMEWAPAWIVKDVSRRDDSKKGLYFIPEVYEWHQQVEDAAARKPGLEVAERMKSEPVSV